MSSVASRRIRFVDRLSSPGWVVFTGVMLGLSFPPFPFYPLALVALVPMLARWSRQPALPMLFREAYSAFLIFAAFSGYWVLFHAEMMKALLLGVGILTLPLLMTLPILGSSVVARRFGMGSGLVALVAGWLTLEYLLLHGPVGLPWLLLGHTQANAVPFHQIADLGGIGGLTLWVWAVNLTVFGLIQSRSLTLRFAMVIGAIALVLAPVGYRGWRLASLPPAHDSLRVTIAQPALSPKAWSEVASHERVQVLGELSDRALAGLPVATEGGVSPSTLVIWPEAALPVFPDERLQHTLYARVNDWTVRRRVALLTGAVTRFDTAPALTVEPYLAQQMSLARPYYNSAILFDPRNVPQQYDMIRMLPVADNVPATGLHPGHHLGITRGFGKGAQRTVFQASHTRFSTLLASEVLFGDHARHMVHDGAEFLAVLANTGWWSYPAAHNQYLALTRLRAIETRRAIVVASVAGGSGMILPDGRIASVLPWMQQRTTSVSVPLHVSHTPYVRSGDVLHVTGTFFTLLIALIWGMAALFFPAPAASGPVPAPSARPRRRMMLG